MTKSEQTPEKIYELYTLTHALTRQLQPHYYYQYTGDITDLASDYFTEFMTPKARQGEKQSLLDKFDPSITTLAHLVKVSVIRKLIDSSRRNPATMVSIDKLVAEFGDLVTKNFNLAEQVEERYVNVPLFVKRFNSLPEEARNKLYNEIQDSDSELRDKISPVIRYYKTSPVFRCTDKSLVLYIGAADKFVSFNTQTGIPRGGFKPFNIPPQHPILKTEYKSYLSEDNFLNYIKHVEN